MAERVGIGKCEFCGHEVDWEDDGTARGELWPCSKCGKVFCSECLAGRHGLDALWAAMRGKPLCPDCYGAVEPGKGIVAERDDVCIFCGRPAEAEHHLIFGTAGRELCERDGLKVPICNNCHNMGEVTRRIHDNPMAERLSKMLGQAVFEGKIGTREQFRERYGKSYL